MSGGGEAIGKEPEYAKGLGLGLGLGLSCLTLTLALAQNMQRVLGFWAFQPGPPPPNGR